MNTTYYCPEEDAMERLGQAMAKALVPGLCLFLQGDLGTGKTTLSRALIKAMGHKGAVKSPTFTLVEPYEHLSPAIYHFDLYRLEDPEELEWMGIRDYLDKDGVCLLEWPEKGQGYLPSVDIAIEITHAEPGRQLSFTADTPQGMQYLKQLDALMES